MKFKPPKLFVSPEQYDLIEAADLIHEVEESFPYDKHREFIEQQCREYHSKREKQLRQKLEAAGYNFETGYAFVHFLKTRCNLVLEPNRKVNMYIDGKLFTTWWETYETQIDTSEPGTIKATTICGLPPKEI